ncbi:sugar phosphate isomerase/epimerase [Hoeflea sp. WL0058]|uniref:Sugar phosphate isomerase/epimerase n=1 Tax=Flavimaribacter sediminis TaxID=2865987 RepID=A0AAE2ZMD1_9HYPH|nr:sugar phosphate isomerase/epimerase family protein [Flavimaribacter sediminis]MBW8637242.1 sugar phosphate isomerase/epimerase [Flavimaribacter sediminis]
MKIYLCSEVVRELDFADQCRFAREVGYDGLEVAPFTLSDEPQLLSSDKIAELRKIADGEGVEIAGLHWLMATPEGLSITSTDPAVAERTVDFGKRLVTLCADLGGGYLVHGSPFQRVLEDDNEADSRQRGFDYFAAMGDAAGDAGVRYLIEPLSRNDTRFINTVEEAITIIEATGSQALGTMIDCYAAASNGEDVARALEHWISRGVVSHIHFNDDNKRGPGEGSTDFLAIVETLRKLDYSGTTAVEPFIYQPDGCSCAARSIGYLKGLMGRRPE